MKIRIIAIGKALDRSLGEVVSDFEKRLSSQAQIEWQLISPALSSVPDECRSLESDKIMARLKENDCVVLLDERGKMPDNQAFARLYDGWRSQQGQLVFVIGGAYGVTESFRARAAYVWSLSPLVFPHQIIRLLLVEQLYRTHAILAGHPYHHV